MAGRNRENSCARTAVSASALLAQRRIDQLKADLQTQIWLAMAQVFQMRELPVIARVLTTNFKRDGFGLFEFCHSSPTDHIVRSRQHVWLKSSIRVLQLDHELES